MEGEVDLEERVDWEVDEEEGTEGVDWEVDEEEVESGVD